MLLASLSALTLLAAAAAEPTTAQVGVGWLIAGGMASLVSNVVTIIVAFRRNPPIGETLHQNFMPRSEHDEEVRRIDKRIDDSFDAVATLTSTNTKAFQDFERALGRIEGQLERLTP